ncbi:MAG: MiaB/RimO family radical SAM methylthiotransferase [Lentisphaeria bacterium]|nr:MiaB/RimO family radical SAM methylthiotransferase [Lentisphaeria bacterium]
MSPKATIHTLGCRLNQADEALIAGALTEAGFAMVPWGEPADLIVINSCTVTGLAAQKTRQAARSARRRNPGAYLVLAGCEVNAAASDWDPLTVVDQLIANPDKMALVTKLPAAILPSPKSSCGTNRTVGGDGFVLSGTGYYQGKTRANLKIQEGCDGLCSYCIVPRARGASRSRDWDDILRETAALVRAGHKEVILTGVNIAKFASGSRRLPELVQALLKETDHARFRLSSTELCPELDDIIELMAEEPRVCRFLHLPIQHGDDDILKAMNRPYSVAEFSAVIENACRRIPGVCLGTDIIAGFPRETDTRFSRSQEAVTRLPFAFFHVFRYSQRPGTPAADMPGQVPGEVIMARAKILAGVSKQKAAAFAQSQVGNVVDVLTENTNSRGLREGWTDNYLRVELTDKTIPRNAMLPVRLTEVIEGRHMRGTASV